MDLSSTADLKSWKTRMAVGRMAYESGHFSQATKHFRLALDQVEERELGNEFGCQTLVSLAKALACQGVFDEAERYLLRAEQMHSEDAVERAWDYEELSQLYWQTGRRQHSEDLAAKALKILEQCDEQPAELKAKILRNLARARAESGDLRGAEKLIDSALLLIEGSELGKQSLIYGEVLVIKAVLLAEQDKLDESAATYHQAMQLVRMNRGPYHPRIAQLLEYFADYTEGKGMLELSERFRKRSAEVRQVGRKWGIS